MKDKNLISENRRLRKIAGLLVEDEDDDDLDLSDAPDFHVSKFEKAIRHITKLPQVSLEFKTKKNNRSSTIKRGGPGFKGTYEELKDKITNYSKKATEDVARKLGITWEEMIVFYVVDGRTVNKLFAVIGRDQEGKRYMYDRYGLGAGSYSKLRPETGDPVFVQSFLYTHGQPQQNT